MVATYSGGMRRRLDLAMTLMGKPRVIFLDEPTTGLDPRGRRTMWRIIRELVTGGVTILLTTQYLEEADAETGHTRGPRRAALRPSGGMGGRCWHRRPFGSRPDGSVATVRALLGLAGRPLGARRIPSVRTADLDDVFFALTGSADREGVR
jgi:ABC-2 type transport system ATP-binding protein